MVRAAVVGLALAAAFVPLPAPLVERAYSTSFYPLWQSLATSISNVVPLAVFDFLIAGVLLAWMLLAAVDLRRSRGWGRAFGRVLVRTAVWSAAFYLLFLASWGLNYRRLRLEDTLAFDRSRVSPEAARNLAGFAVMRLNALYEDAYRETAPDPRAIDPGLASAFVAALRDVGATRAAVTARAKRTLLDVYFRRAAVDGMTDPFFLETLIVSDLLPVEQPFTTAHEWAHLGGYAHEGEANLIGWLACMHGNARHQYSGWLFLYAEAAATLGSRDRGDFGGRLAAGPRADLRAIAERIRRNRSPRVSQVGWTVYNQYLKANRIESGVASYTEVVRLILGTRFNPIVRVP
jgi:uncharacterized protein DUF3810